MIGDDETLRAAGWLLWELLKVGLPIAIAVFQYRLNTKLSDMKAELGHSVFKANEMWRAKRTLEEDLLEQVYKVRKILTDFAIALSDPGNECIKERFELAKAAHRDLMFDVERCSIHLDDDVVQKCKDVVTEQMMVLFLGAGLFDDFDFFGDVKNAERAPCISNERYAKSIGRITKSNLDAIKKIRELVALARTRQDDTTSTRPVSLVTPSSHI